MFMIMYVDPPPKYPLIYPKYPLLRAIKTLYKRALWWDPGTSKILRYSHPLRAPRRPKASHSLDPRTPAHTPSPISQVLYLEVRGYITPLISTHEPSSKATRPPGTRCGTSSTLPRSRTKVTRQRVYRRSNTTQGLGRRAYGVSH